MATIIEKKVTALQHHRTALEAELKAWKALAQRGGLLEKHQTQLKRITDQLYGFLETIDDAEQAGDAFKKIQILYPKTLGAYRIWSYFRSKFALRQVAVFQDLLRCADELAWAAYKPAYESAKAAGIVDVKALKEPPLVYFSSYAAPFVQARDTAFVPEGISERDIEAFGIAILTLPVPVISVPWFQLNHLPDAVVIAHEVGHAVEHDFNLRTPLEEIFNTFNGSATPDQRRQAWLSWRHEIFADVYAILCTGPAYVISLISYLLDDRDSIRQERITGPEFGAYPTRYLRVLINLETLQWLGYWDAMHIPNKLKGVLSSLQSVWKDTYQFHAMPDYESDIAPLIEALLTTKFASFGGQALTDVIVFSIADLEDVGTQLERWLNNISFKKDGSAKAFLHLFAATTVAYHLDQNKYLTGNHHQKILNNLLGQIPKGVRSANPEALLPAGQKTQEALDRASGRLLASQFGL